MFIFCLILLAVFGSLFALDPSARLAHEGRHVVVTGRLLVPAFAVLVVAQVTIGSHEGLDSPPVSSAPSSSLLLQPATNIAQPTALRTNRTINSLRGALSKARTMSGM